MLPRPLINSNCRLYFCLKDEKKGKNHPHSTISSVTLKRFFFVCYGQVPQQISDFTSGPERAEISLFSNDFRDFTFAFRLFFFCHFPAIIVQILSFERKLLLGIEYPFEETVQNSQVDHTTTPLTIQSRPFRQDLVMKKSKPRLTCCVC